MSKYSVTSGVQTAPVKVVLYGPEGIERGPPARADQLGHAAG